MKEDGLINSKDVDLVAVMADGVAGLFFLPPLATFAVTAARSITQLNEDEFKEKLKLFLTEADSPKEYQDKFLKVLDKDLEIFFRRLFKVLDRIDDHEKATIVGKLFKALLQDKIDRDDFKELSSKVEKSYIDDLYLLDEFVAPGKGTQVSPDSDLMSYEYTFKFSPNSGSLTPILALGFVYEDVKITSTNRYDENEINQNSKYILSDLGKKLLIYGLY